MILVFGTVCLDRIRRVPHMPKRGGYVEIESEQFVLGGEAANTANALATWHADVVLAGNGFGDDQSGEMLRQVIEAKKMKRFEAHLSPTNITPVCDVYVSDDGERTMIGAGFSQMAASVSVEKLPYARDQWFTAEPNMSSAARAAELASEAGMKLYLMDFLREGDPIYPGSFWQCSTDWAGTRNNLQRNVDFVRKFVAKHGCFAVLSDGPNGFVAGSPELPTRAYPPFPAPALLDATGAGDMFRAGMLFGLDQGWPIPRCLCFASAAGSLTVGVLGATIQVPSVRDIEELIGMNPQVARQYEA